MGQPIKQLDMQADDIASEVGKFSADADMVVDGLFGTGLTGQLKPEHAQLIQSINAMNIPVLAVDIPSGLDCDSGEPMGGGECAIRAKYTVTFVAVKKGFVSSEEASDYTGEIFVSSIGVAPADRESS